MGLANFALGRPAEAAGWTQRAMREKVGMTWAYRDLATFLAHAGEIERAREALAKFTASRPTTTIAKVRDALRFIEPAPAHALSRGTAGWPGFPSEAPTGGSAQEAALSGAASPESI